MCKTPIFVKAGVVQPCRKCPLCMANYRKDWLGRCIAEKQDAVDAHMITLTYGADPDGRKNHPHSQILMYRDVQLFLKKLRKRNKYPLRYFIAGEFGSLKGRAHWHMIAYWQSDRNPARDLGQRINIPEWPHGYVQFDELTDGSIKYVLKYVTKQANDHDPLHQNSFYYSKVPELGAEFFKRLAQKWVDLKSSVRTITYELPDIRDPATGQLVQFLMSGVTKKHFIEEYKKLWAEQNPGVDRPYSALIDKVEDEENRFVSDLREPRRVKAELPDFLPAMWPPLEWDRKKEGDITRHLVFRDKLNSWSIDIDDPETGEITRLYWTYDKEGNRAWLDRIGNIPETQTTLVRPTYQDFKSIG